MKPDKRLHGFHGEKNVSSGGTNHWEKNYFCLEKFEPFPLAWRFLRLLFKKFLSPAWSPLWNCILELPLEASPDGRPLTEKQRCSGSYRRAVSFQVFKDDSISQRPSLRRLRSRSTVHARRNLPVKEFCYLRTVNLTAAMCRQVNGKVQDSTWQVRKWGRHELLEGGTVRDERTFPRRLLTFKKFTSVPPYDLSTGPSHAGSRNSR